MGSQEEAWLLEEKYKGEKSKAFFADLERLQAGEPLAYLIGHTPFLGCTIYLDSKPLIPRPETEYWVEQAIDEIKNAHEPTKILDLCAGTGAIGVAVAKNVPSSKVDFAEVDSTHLPTINKNILSNRLDSKRFNVLEGNLFSCVKDKYDFILSNPPYIDPALDRTEMSVKDHEPHLALYGGKQGFELIERIIKESPGYLNEHGQLWLEHEPEQSARIKELAFMSGFVRVITYLDQYDIERYSVLAI